MAAMLTRIQVTQHVPLALEAPTHNAAHVQLDIFMIPLFTLVSFARVVSSVKSCQASRRALDVSICDFDDDADSRSVAGSTTFSNCQTCTAAGCLQCVANYGLASGACSMCSAPVTLSDGLTPCHSCLFLIYFRTLICLPFVS